MARKNAQLLAVTSVFLLLLAAPLAATTWEIVKGGVNAVDKSGTFRSFVFAQNKFVAVGDAGLVATSPDGRTWTEIATRPTTLNFYEVRYGNGLFVAVGRDGIIFSSPDAATWTQRVAADGISLTSVAYNGTDLWVAGGVGGKMLTSSNGTSWTRRANIPSGMQVDGMAYGNGRWVAAGSGGRLHYSANGISWSAPATNTGANNYSLLYANGLFVVGGQNGTCYTSPDGISWTRRTTAQTNYLMGQTHDGTHFIAGGNSDGVGCSMVLTSHDTATWLRDRDYDYSTLLGAASGTVTVMVNGSPVQRNVTVLGGARKLILYNTSTGIGDGRGCDVPPALTLTAPNGGEFYKWGDPATITWTSRNLNDPVSGNPMAIRIRFSGDNGADGYPYVLVDSTPNTGSYGGVVPSGVTSAQCRVKVVPLRDDGSETTPSDVSDNLFEVGEYKFTLTAPNGGETLVLGTTTRVTWTTVGVTSPLRLLLYRDGVKVGIMTINMPASQTSYVWTVGKHDGGMAPAGTGYTVLLRTEPTVRPILSDGSNAAFTLSTPAPTGTITVTSPNVVGVSWRAGTTHNIVWRQTGMSGTVTIALYKGGVLNRTIATAAVTALKYAWTVPATQTVGSDYKVRIYQGAVGDYSDNNFSITK